MLTYTRSPVIGLLFFLTLTSCSWIKAHLGGISEEDNRVAVYSEFSQNDYIEHLAALADDYINSNDVRIIKLSRKSKEYLKDIYYRIFKNNELLLNNELLPTFYIVKKQIPFYFSLPKGYIFLSVGLINKYIKNEGMLISLLAYEIIKMHKNLYEKKIIIPTGHIGTERMLALTRVPLEVKVEIDKWTFYAMKRAGFDAYAFLNWLQMQNKHLLDFTMQHGSSRNISREEYMFKSFIVKEGVVDRDERRFGENSSPQFYYLLKELNRKSL